METLKSLISDESLQKLATPSDLRLGKEIIETGSVEIIENSPFKILAKATARDGQKRTVELFATDEGLKCSCT
jgi:hypothetical protein